MDPLEELFLDITRRRFFGEAAVRLGAGFGVAALASLLGAADGAGRRIEAGNAPHAPKPSA